MTEQTARKLTMNALSNATGLVVFVLSNLIVVSMLVHKLGVAVYGHAAFVLALASPLVLIGPIVSQTLVSLGSNAAGRHQYAELGVLYRKSMRISAAILAPLGVLIFFGLMAVEAVMPGLEGVVKARDLVFVVTALCLRQFAAIGQGCVAALQRYRLLGIVVALNALVDLSIIYAAMIISPGITAYFVGLLLSALNAMAVCLIVARLLLQRACKASMSRLDETGTTHGESRFLLSFGSWQGLSALSGLGASQVNPVFLGLLGAPVQLAHYNIAARLEQAATSILTKLFEVLLPHFGGLSKEDKGIFHNQYLVTTWLIGVASAAIMVPLSVLAGPILALWINSQVAVDGAPVLRILLIWGLLNLANTSFNYLLLATGGAARLAKINLLYGAIAIMSTVMIGVLAGPMYAPYGLVFAAIVSFFLKLVGIKQLIGMPQSVLLLAVRTLLPATTGFLTAFGLSGLMPSQSLGWVGLIGTYTALGICVLLSNFLLVSIRAQDRWLLRPILTLARRQSSGKGLGPR